MDLREITEFFKDISKYIIIFVVMVLIFIFVFAFQPIAGNSMYPTLEEGNVVTVQKLSKTFQRNEIVIFKDSKGKNYVKRIIGLPGEEVHYLNGILYIDSQPYKEVFLSNDIITSNFMFIDICNLNDCPNGIIPDDKYLVLGDNRPESVDSRDPLIGLVSKNQIEGKVLYRVWPLNKIGKIQ